MRRLDYIAHHGIKGQKWGIRRFQDKDGSLTPAGKKRYGYSKEDRARYIAKKTAGIDKDIHSYDSLRGKGLTDKKGRVIFTKEDIENQVKSLEAVKAKTAARADYKYTRKYGKQDHEYIMNAYRDSKGYSVYNKMAEQINKKLPELNKKYSNMGREEYDKAILKEMNKVNMSIAKEYGTSPSGRYTMQIVNHTIDSLPDIGLVDLWDK